LTFNFEPEIDMTPTWIATFFLLGCAFGLATFRVRHLFSEGPSKPQGREADGPAALAMWVCIATTLWPVLALAGAYGAWRRSLRR
jgi:hypothetical protein